jgi:hypothetical protein
VKFSRRQFLGALATSVATIAATRAFSGDVISNTRPFEMLAVGDSLMSAQGLRPEHKFSWLVKEWVEKEVFAGRRSVNYKSKAHSGARISLHLDEEAKMQKMGDNAKRFHHPEINISFPCIGTQIDVARDEYADPALVDLILLSGGITDVLVANVVNPFVKEGELLARIDQYCNTGMTTLLRRATTAFPNATIAVVGYFPVISTQSDVEMIARYLFKAMKVPHPVHFGMVNPFSKQFLKVMRKKMAQRSELWVAESNRALKKAVHAANAAFKKDRIFFVETPITANTCFATKATMLWATNEDNLPADEMYSTRVVECPKAFGEIKYHHYGKHTVRMCELAAIGHPNLDGSIAYANAIKKVVVGVVEDIASQRSTTNFNDISK